MAKVPTARYMPVFADVNIVVAQAASTPLRIVRKSGTRAVPRSTSPIVAPKPHIVVPQAPPVPVTPEPPVLETASNGQQYYRGFTVPVELLDSIKTYVDQHEQYVALPDVLGAVSHSVSDPSLRAAGVQELIGVSYQTFTDWSPDRKDNIALAMQVLDGLWVAPGQRVSYNHLIGEVSARTGYKRTKIILNSAEQWGIGGGVCQSSTAAYQVAFNTGLQINERRNHTYWYPEYYLDGMDATTYTGSPDMVFTNTSGNPVLLQVVMRENQIYTLAYGTPFAVVQAERTSRSGNKWNGLTTSWRRTVTPFYGEATDETFTSRYRGQNYL